MTRQKTQLTIDPEITLSGKRNNLPSNLYIEGEMIVRTPRSSGMNREMAIAVADEFEEAVEGILRDLDDASTEDGDTRRRRDDMEEILSEFEALRADDSTGDGDADAEIDIGDGQ